MDRTPICNHDCFNCKYPDCYCTDYDCKDIHEAIAGALYGWDAEIRAQRIKEMLARGHDRNTIIIALDITPSEYTSALYKIKKAARDCNHKAAQIKNISLTV